MHLLKNNFPFWNRNQAQDRHKNAKLFFNKYYVLEKGWTPL